MPIKDFIEYILKQAALSVSQYDALETDANFCKDWNRANSRSIDPDGIFCLLPGKKLPPLTILIDELKHWI